MIPSVERSTLGDGGLRAVRRLAPLAVINSLVTRVCCVGVRIQTLCQMVSCSFCDPKVHSSPGAERERGKEQERERSWKRLTKDSKILTFIQRYVGFLIWPAHQSHTLCLQKETLVASSDSNKKNNPNKHKQKKFRTTGSGFESINKMSFLTKKKKKCNLKKQ